MNDVVRAFDRYAEDYDEWFDSPKGRIIFEMEAGAVRLLMKGLEKPFLEVGVGTGRFAEELGIEAGIEPSSRALEMAKKRGIRVKKAKGEKLPFKDNSFGAIFLLLTLCFVNDAQKVISGAERALKKGGGLIIGIINRESRWGQLYMKKKSDGHPIYKYASFYSINEVAEMIEEAGMAVKAYSSTLCRPPSDKPAKEPPHTGLTKDAGFVCILARKAV